MRERNSEKPPFDVLKQTVFAFPVFISFLLSPFFFILFGILAGFFSHNVTASLFKPELCQFWRWGVVPHGGLFGIIFVLRVSKKAIYHVIITTVESFSFSKVAWYQVVNEINYKTDYKLTISVTFETCKCIVFGKQRRAEIISPLLLHRPLTK